MANHTYTLPLKVFTFLLFIVSMTVVIILTTQTGTVRNYSGISYKHNYDAMEDLSSDTQYSDVVRNSSGRTTIAIGINRILRSDEIANRDALSPLHSELVKLNLKSVIDDVQFEDNRVLYKFYRKTQDPTYECIIRVLKFRKAPSSDNIYHNKWTKYGCSRISDFHCSVETKYSLDLGDFREADVAMLIEGQFFKFSNWSGLVNARPRGQLWVLYSKESPVHEPNFAPPPDIIGDSNPYNLTMTFRSDSDFVMSYGHFEPADQSEPPKPPGTFVSNKKRLIMWMASRCSPLGWERTKFVEELQQHISVDIYGKCGTLDCPKNDAKACLTLRKQYKFYLALENSECAEYITEKLWTNAYRTGLVPIVYGAPREDYARITPPNSFIHLADFRSMHDFVEYIKLLDQNDTLYENYFQWKKMGRNEGANGFVNSTNLPNLCIISQRLVEISLYPGRSWKARNPSFSKWWTESCHHRDELLGIKI